MPNVKQQHGADGTPEADRKTCNSPSKQLEGCIAQGAVTNLEDLLNPKILAKYTSTLHKDVDDQAAVFLKSMIFALGDNWAEVGKLAKEWKVELLYRGLKSTDPALEEAQFMKFFQHMGKARTAQQTRRDYREMDALHDGKYHFLHFLMMYYRTLILEEHFKRQDNEPKQEVDLDNLVGLGHMIVQVSVSPPFGLSPELEEAIETFQAAKRVREQKMHELEEKAAAGGVRGKAAKNELDQMVAADATELNRMELSLAAATRIATKKSVERKLAAAQLQAQSDEARKKEESRSKMNAMAGMFGGMALKGGK